MDTPSLKSSATGDNTFVDLDDTVYRRLERDGLIARYIGGDRYRLTWAEDGSVFCCAMTIKNVIFGWGSDGHV